MEANKIIDDAGTKKKEPTPAPDEYLETTGPAVTRARRDLRYRIPIIALSLLCAGGGYALTLITPWLWIAAVPLFILACVFLPEGLTGKLCGCPYCGILIRVAPFHKSQTCSSCNREFTLE